MDHNRSQCPMRVPSFGHAMVSSLAVNTMVHCCLSDGVGIRLASPSRPTLLDCMTNTPILETAPDESMNPQSLQSERLHARGRVAYSC